MARLDRDAVLRAGLALADAGDLDAVTLRAVADRLGVTPMALYRHVEGKTDLLDGMADLLYAELDVPEQGSDWWEELAALARSTRRVLLAHPAAATLFSRPLAGPHSLRLGDALLDTLQRAGFYPAEAEELHEQLSQMVFGLVLPELHPGPKRGRRAGTPPSSAESSSFTPVCSPGSAAEKEGLVPRLRDSRLPCR